MLTVIGEQDNTIRVLSKAIGQNHNDQQLHDMHNSLFGGLVSGSGTGREGLNLKVILTQITTFINQQNQQIQTLIMQISRFINAFLVQVIVLQQDRQTKRLCSLSVKPIAEDSIFSLLLICSKEIEHLPTKHIYYALHLYFHTQVYHRLRKVSQQQHLSPFIKSNHVSIWNWIQHYNKPEMSFHMNKENL